VDHVCPLLGLAGERRVVIDGADGGHRCHAEDPPASIDRATQVRLCLTPAYDRCERFAAYLALRPGTTPGRSAAGDGFVSTRQVLTAQPPWRGVAGRARRSRSVALVAGVAGAAALGVAGVAVAGTLAGGAAGESASPTAGSPSPTPTATPRPSATPTPSASAEPTASPTPTPPATPEPTPPPTPAPTLAPVVTYTVVAGDTLNEIAVRFGTSVDALMAANDIDDPSQIRIGQVLVIP
jgi:LysM repeat protein